jgi:hypothetical protein
MIYKGNHSNHKNICNLSNVENHVNRKSIAMLVTLVTDIYLTITITVHLQGPHTIQDVTGYSLVQEKEHVSLYELTSHFIKLSFMLVKVFLSTIRVASSSNHGDLWLPVRKNCTLGTKYALYTYR